MREIKFRGKRVDNGEWVEGYYFEGFTGIPYVLTLHDHILGMTKFYEVIPETVGQSTGLHDKNGVEIYEGDIVVAQNGVKQGVVVYQAPSFVIKEKLTSKRWSEFILASSENQFQTVIGNIHEKEG